MPEFNHSKADITWELISGSVRGIYVVASITVFIYFILCNLDYVDVLDISPWAHILTWTVFSVVSVVLCIMHFVLSYAINEPSVSLSTSVLQNLCVSLTVTLASIIVYVQSDNTIEGTVMTTGMTQFFDRRKHFFLIILIIGTIWLFSNCVSLAVLYRK